MEEAIFRANAYIKAGADIAFVEAPISVDEVRKIAMEVKAPILYNIAGMSPYIGLEELERIGIKMVIYPAISWRSQAVHIGIIWWISNREIPQPFLILKI